MYGTLARMKVSRENMDELRETMTPPDRTIEGQRATYVVVPDHWKDEVWLLAVFDDKATYDKNAASPEQHEEYKKYRALLDAEPSGSTGRSRSTSPNRPDRRARSGQPSS